MANSSYTGMHLVDQARSHGDLAPVLPTGGFYETVALSAINDTMTDMLLGSARGSRFNFKFNRILINPFWINSWQQDYASPQTNLGWLESCLAYNTSSPSFSGFSASGKPSITTPKFTAVIEVKRDILLTGPNGQGQYVPKIAWMENDTLTFGQWGQSTQNSLSGLFNPGPGAVYTNPLGLTAIPINPITQVQDAAGNLWILTPTTPFNTNGGYGSCGTFNPFTPTSTSVVISGGTVTVTAPNGLSAGTVVVGSGFATLTGLNGLSLTVLTASSTQFTAATTLSNGSDTAGTFSIAPVYPTFSKQTTVATTVMDGTVQWTAVWPKGQGFRISPMPSQTGPVWQIAPVGQARIQQFTNLKQILDPIPDDYFRYFKQGFFCYCYLASPDPKVRARFAEEKRLWMESLNLCVSQGSREDDDWTFCPTTASVMDTGWTYGNQSSPAWPYGNWSY
jgi:hypothetical protein